MPLIELNRNTRRPDEARRPEDNDRVAARRPDTEPAQAEEAAHGATLGFVGAKGGVGSTVLASSLAWALAQRGQRVVLLDLDEGGGQAALHLCERNAGPTVQDALQAIDRLDTTLLDTLLTPCSPSLRLLPAPRQWGHGPAEGRHRAADLLKLVRTASSLADWVVLDLPHDALTQDAYGAVLRQLQEVLLVSEPTLPATFNARRSAQWLRDHRPPTALQPQGFDLVMNKVHRHHTLPTEQILRTLGMDGEGGGYRELPRSDGAVAQATYQGQAVGAVDPKDALSKALSRWAAELAARASTDGEAATLPEAFTGLEQWRDRWRRWAS